MLEHAYDSSMGTESNGMNSTANMEAALKDLSTKGILLPRTENNKYLKVSYKGAGGLVPTSWNVKIYTSGAVVTPDEHLLMSLADGTFKKPDTRLKVLQLDDTGWGFPLCGVMVGVSDGQNMMTAVVDVRWFKKGVFDTGKYLYEYSRVAREVMKDDFSASPEVHRVEICTGYVNSVLKEDLRKEGYDVRVAKITGFLQDKLESSYKEYVRIALGADMAYDPKQMAGGKPALARKYASVLEWGRKHRPDMLKDGWKSMA
jgi:hypothetical protein